MSHWVSVRPIRTDDDHEQALSRIAVLMGSAEDSAEGDELDVLLTLVQAFEREHYDAPKGLDAIDFIRHVMDVRGLSQSDLVPALGAQSRVSEVLSRKRPLSVRMMRNLHVMFGIPLDILIEATEDPKHQATA